MMKYLFRSIVLLFILVDIFLLGKIFFSGKNIELLNPQGLIALQERNLMFTATLLMLLVVIPVFILTFYIVWRYRAGNTKATYKPDWDHDKRLEFLWWAIPFVIIFILSIITWQSTHQLDPFKPFATTKKPLVIQVVALEWRWLFIYPGQNIATVNFVQFPQNTPITFEVSADAPMNSFWIPQLAGQIYAMNGMSTQLHVIADHAGSYNGFSANISGKGFANMHFIAKSSRQSDFDRWVLRVKQTQKALTVSEYTRLSQPSENPSVLYYSSTEPDLYRTIIMKFMRPEN